MKYLNDIELIRNFDNRSQDALAEIYNRYSHLVYGVCLKYLESKEESLDTVVEIFESLLDKIPANTITNFKSWLYSVTKNHCLMKLRKSKRQQQSLESQYSYETNFYNPEVLDEETVQYEQIESALLQLSEEQQICIELFYYQQKSYVEIAKETGYPVKSIKSYLQNGRIKLKKIIEEQL